MSDDWKARMVLAAMIIGAAWIHPGLAVMLLAFILMAGWFA